MWGRDKSEESPLRGNPKYAHRGAVAADEWLKSTPQSRQYFEHVKLIVQNDLTHP
jgi:hypothetical protein